MGLTVYRIKVQNDLIPPPNYKLNDFDPQPIPFL